MKTQPYKAGIPIALFIIAVCLLTPAEGLCQGKVSGRVLDEGGGALIGAHVYWAEKRQQGVFTGMDGAFSLPAAGALDTLVASYIGYETWSMPAGQIGDSAIQIEMSPAASTLGGVTVEASSIAEEFSVIKIDRITVYTNPMSSADPLKAVASIPAATNADETAQPSLRGSSAGRTRVVLNGVPIYRPVKSTELNGVGYFSVFNPEFVESMNVYAGNPPLTYGNSSAGLIEIKTSESLEGNQTHASLSLASAGLLMTRKIGESESSFIQAYANVQRSPLFRWANSPRFNFLQRFSTSDAGLYFHHAFSNRLRFSLYSYGILDAQRVNIPIFSYRGESANKSRRNFNILTLRYRLPNLVLTYAQGTDFGTSSSELGNLEVNYRNKRLYQSIDAKWLKGNRVSVQGGVNMEMNSHRFAGQFPKYTFSFHPGSPVFEYDTLFSSPVFEGYLYGKYEHRDWVVGGGVRQSLPGLRNDSYLSYQGSIRWKRDRHSLLLAAGQYHSYSIPDVYQQSSPLLDSRQLSLEYQWEGRNTRIQAAPFLKSEGGTANPFEGEIKNLEIKGLELAISQSVGKRLELFLANTTMDIRYRDDAVNWVEASNSFAYFLKASCSYSNKLGVFSVSAILRPGSKYTPIVDAVVEEGLDVLRPVYSGDTNGSRLNSYQNFTAMYNRYMPLPKGRSMVIFATLANLANRRNVRSWVYNDKYQIIDSSDFQRRMYYVGAVFYWK